MGVLTTPTDEQLVAYFLRNKILRENTSVINMFTIEVGVCTSHPTKLPREHHT